MQHGAGIGADEQGFKLLGQRSFLRRGGVAPVGAHSQLGHAGKVEIGDGIVFGLTANLHIVVVFCVLQDVQHLGAVLLELRYGLLRRSEGQADAHNANAQGSCECGFFH